MLSRLQQFAWASFFSLSFLVSSFSSSLAANAAASPPNFNNCLFRDLWEYSDLAVNQGQAGRGYTWGLESYGTYEESYTDAPTQQRLVQYFAKSRMELAGDGKSVTTGLLTKELVSGLVQEGDNSFRQLAPATIAVAGDATSDNPSPSYASFKAVVSLSPTENRAPAQPGQLVTAALNQSGQVTTLANLPAQVKIGGYRPELGHNVPEIFLKFQSAQGKVWQNGWQQSFVYTADPTSNVFGLPISEPYWVQASVGGQLLPVLVQLFERRILTYTPSNSPEYQVEMGNIGQHYHLWRYNGVPGPQTSACAIDLTAHSQSGTVRTPRAPVNCAVAKCIALTYDDGPTAYTPMILDALKARSAVATFFVLGDKLDYFKPTLNRILQEGNEIGNHSWSHPHLPKLSAGQVRSEIQRTQDKIKLLTGYLPLVMRPPYGETNPTVARNVGLPQILWSVETFDWRDSNTYLTTQRALAQARPGRIILMHDTHRSTALAAPAIIDGLQGQGYTLVTISELFDLANNPARLSAGQVVTAR